jgi:chitodextrinase
VGRAVVLGVLLLLLAGCVQPSGSPAGAEREPAAPAAPAPGDAQPLVQLPLVPVAKANAVSRGSEPSILADRNGKYLWIGDTDGGHVSTDNGTSWRSMAPIALGFHFLNDGWGLAQDEAGNLYAADLSENHVDIGRSSDGGMSWNQRTYLAGVSGVADRPWIAASKGHVVLFYFDAPLVATGFWEHCAHSTDGGATFTERNPIAGFPQGGKAFFDDKGRFYYSQSDGVLYRFASCIGGATRIDMIPDAGVNNMIQADVEGTDLYMAAATDGAARITLAGSRDGGPVKSLTVSPPELKSNTFASVSVHEGQVAVAWYGSTSSGNPSQASFSGEWNTYLAIVDGFWTDEPSVRTQLVSSAPNHQGFICMGGISCTGGRGLLDYFMVDHDRWGGIHVAYVDDTSGAQVLHVRVPPEVARPAAPAGPGTGRPLAAFALEAAGLTVSADATGSAASDGSTLEHAWDWGDGATGTGATAQHTYAEPGEYRVVLTVTEASGATAQATKTVRVDGETPPPPVAGLSFLPAAPRAGQAVAFKDASTGTALTRRSWDFGDGGKAEGATVQHAYAKEGTYTVRLTVTDAAGQSDDHAVAVKVLPAPSSGKTDAAAQAQETPAIGLPMALAALAVAAAAGLRPRRR